MDKKSGEESAVLFDSRKKTKTIFRYLNGTSIESLLSDQGNLLYLGLPRNIPCPAPSGAKGKIVKFGDPNKLKDYFQLSDSGGIYLIELKNNMRVVYHEYGDTESDPRFSKDGNVFHANNNLLNVSTRQVKKVYWVSSLSHYNYTMSPDGNYIISSVGMFSANNWVEGQWGMEVYTPQGNFLLSSPSTSLLINEIENNGTILDARGYVFKFEDGFYKCVKSPENKPLNDLRVRKF